MCALFTFEEELYLSKVEITVRYALKTSYCRDGSAHSTALPQSLWDGTVSDITGRIPWKREISFLFILSGSDKTHATSPFSHLEHTHVHTQTACLQALSLSCCLNQTLIYFNWWETNYNSFLKCALILRPQRRAKHKNDRTKWSREEIRRLLFSYYGPLSICNFLTEKWRKKGMRFRIVMIVVAKPIHCQFMLKKSSDSETKLN